MSSCCNCKCSCSDVITSLKEEIKSLHEAAIESEKERTILMRTLDSERVHIQGLMDANDTLRANAISLQQIAEQEEEAISNALLKKIEQLKHEKEDLARHVEQEEDYLVNTLMKKLDMLRSDKEKLEKDLIHEHEEGQKKIHKLEADTLAMREKIRAVQLDKIKLENVLEMEQEHLVISFQKKVAHLENEKRKKEGVSELVSKHKKIIRDQDDSRDHIDNEVIHASE